MSEPTFAERVEAATRELAAVTATAEQRQALRQREGRRVAPAMRARLAALSEEAAAAAAVLAALSYEPEPNDRRVTALAVIEEAARAGGYELDGV